MHAISFFLSFLHSLSLCLSYFLPIKFSDLTSKISIVYIIESSASVFSRSFIILRVLIVECFKRVVRETSRRERERVNNNNNNYVLVLRETRSWCKCAKLSAEWYMTIKAHLCEVLHFRTSFLFQLKLILLRLTKTFDSFYLRG